MIFIRRQCNHNPLIELLEAIDERLNHIERAVKYLMSQVEDLTTQVDSLESAINDAKTRVEADIAKLDQTVADLQAQVDANQPVDLQPLVDHVAQLKATVDSIDAPPAPPVEEPPVV